MAEAPDIDHYSSSGSGSGGVGDGNGNDGSNSSSNMKGGCGAFNVPYGGTSIRLFSSAGVLKQGKQKCVFFFGREGDSNIQGLNTTPGDELYSLYAQYDHPFRMEKKLEAYKAIMVRAHHSLMSNSQSSVLHAVQDLGIAKQLGLGVGMPWMSIDESGALGMYRRVCRVRVHCIHIPYLHSFV